MNIAIIFAGGVGSRMGKTTKPKQFLEIDEIPVLIHTLRVFEKNDQIDCIVISCLEDWIEYTWKLVSKYNLYKVKKIVVGGSTGQMSIFNGLEAAQELTTEEDSIVLIHDGVRPFITQTLINQNIKTVKEKGSAISSVLATETFVIVDNDLNINSIPKRKESLIAKAPQSFYLKDIYSAHILAQRQNQFDFVDSCTLMNNFGFQMSVVLTTYDNIKITTPKDLSLAESIHKRLKSEEG